VAVLLIAVGAMVGDPQAMMAKASQVCLECIGLG
jgi:hypothetical protein